LSMPSFWTENARPAPEPPPAGVCSSGTGGNPPASTAGGRPLFVHRSLCRGLGTHRARGGPVRRRSAPAAGSGWLLRAISKRPLSDRVCAHSRSGAYRAILNVFPSCWSLGIRRYHPSNRPYDRSSNGTRRWMQDQGKLVELIPRRDLPSRAAVPSLMSDAQPSWRSSASPCYLAVSSSRRQASRRPR
jgi:hypothetical protein